MPKLKNVEELSKLRDQKRRDMRLADATATRIIVGMGTCGIAAGAKETLTAIKEELSRRQIGATVSIVGCIGICVKEPIVDITQAGRPRVTYGNIVADRVPRLIEEHLIEGRPVREWALARLAVE